jgi:hypothetical protein
VQTDNFKRRERIHKSITRMVERALDGRADHLFVEDLAQHATEGILERINIAMTKSTDKKKCDRYAFLAVYRFYSDYMRRLKPLKDALVQYNARASQN